MATPQENVETLAGLTLKQEAFARHWVMTRSDIGSYKKAGYAVMSEECMRVEAFNIRRTDTVSQRIVELLAEAFKHAKVTPQLIEEKLWLEASNAESDGARATNLKTLGQVHAMLTQKQIIEEQNLSDHDLAMSIASAGLETTPETIDELNETDRTGYNWVIAKLSS